MDDVDTKVMLLKAILDATTQYKDKGGNYYILRATDSESFVLNLQVESIEYFAQNELYARRFLVRIDELQKLLDFVNSLNKKEIK